VNVKKRREIDPMGPRRSRLGTLGPADFDALARDVRARRDRHDDSHPVESWQLDVEWEPASGGL
jgi:hypothetical protein